MFFFQLPWLPELLVRARDFQRVRRAFMEHAVNKERFSETDVAHFLASAKEPGALTAMINWYRAMPWSFAQLRKRGVRQTTMPTLLLWGERDPYFSPAVVQGTEQFVPKLTLELIADASHWVQQDAPERVNTLLESWLAASYRRPSARAMP
jgi:pimeloyl-ACP methyl ester carboxylesterase